MEHLRVADIMTTEVVTIGEDESLEAAEQTMRAGRIHHLPVTSLGRVVGLLAHADILRAQVSSVAELSRAEEEEINRSIPVRWAMSKNVRTVSPSTPILEAAQILLRHKYGCLPVVDGADLVGIVTEGDFVNLVIKALASNEAREGRPRLAHAR